MIRTYHDKRIVQNSFFFKLSNNSSNSVIEPGKPGMICTFSGCPDFIQNILSVGIILKQILDVAFTCKARVAIKSIWIFSVLLYPWSWSVWNGLTIIKKKWLISGLIDKFQCCLILPFNIVY